MVNYNLEMLKTHNEQTTSRIPFLPDQLPITAPTVGDWDVGDKYATGVTKIKKTDP